ncbi:hypothetical protein DJ021_08550 [Phenylobacterium hankyongense]|uniref:Uncharacterized protein n=1 Tax=Phenylobacterium hankyongense TaxID=1813876 RepID=A0A328B0A3_9CAUL|nr:hypothetical protein [Phenylobacterium hankyongense]RAK59851.1 hypothetical protein DJ021_08550 [Phenylobacterium hankyongense]
MTDVTYVSFVPRSRRGQLRSALAAEDTGPISWVEKRRMFGSEFHFSGPSRLVRKTHAYITEWLASDR